MNRSYARILFATAWLVLSLLLVAPRFPAALAQGEAPPDPRPTGIPLAVPVEGEPADNGAPMPDAPAEPEGAWPVARIDGSTVIITWQSATPERAWVRYGPSPDQLDQITHDVDGQNATTTWHRVTISAPSTGPLYYQIVIGGDPSGPMGKVLRDSSGTSTQPDPETALNLPAELKSELAAAVAITIGDFSSTVPPDAINGQPASGRSSFRLQSFAVEGHRFVIRLTGAPQALAPDDWSAITKWIDQAIIDTLAANGASMPPLVEYDIQLNGHYPEQQGSSDDPATIPLALGTRSIQGKKIVLNPGHGRYEASGWPTQRNYYFGVVEDFVNLDMISALDAALATTGADRRPTRQLNRNAGNHPASGRPWWEMGAREFMRYQGLPQSVWNQSNLSNLNRDIMARPNFANYIGANAMISIHNNGSPNGSGAGYGTETWYDTLNGHSAESLRLATLVHNKVIERLQRDWNPNWHSRGIKASAGGYGENRWFNGPAALIEVGFMDNAGDNAAIRDPRFQAIVAGAIKDALVEFYGGSGDPDDNRTIAGGQTLNGTVSPNNDEDAYFFNATANSRATIRMTRTAGTTLDSFLELYAPNGSLIAVDDDSGGNLNSLINNWLLPADGRYKIVARSWSRNSSGPYALSFSLGSGGTVTCPDGQYRAQYYNNRSLSGSPAVTRCEGAVAYDWGGGSPVGGVGADNFSVRWTGRFTFSGGTWRFIARADDGIRVWVDNSLIIDAWRDQGPTEYRAERNLSAGLHEVKVEYYENGGGAVAQVRWESAGLTCSNQYKAEYWNNRYLSGNPVLVRCENWPINWDWGGGSPGSGVPADNFSARWTGTAAINAGTYTFIARADDGIRVWLDNSPIIDAWRDQGPTEYRTTRSVSSGNHTIRVEYYENGGGAVAQFRWETAAAATCNPTADQVALFVDSDYRGQCVLKGVGHYPNPTAIGLPNDAISSVKVGGNVRLSLFEHDNYQGRSSAFTGNDSNLSDNTIGNDAVSSMKVESRGGGGTSGNLALGRYANATSQESAAYSAARGNDGNNGTRWSSAISSSLDGQRWYVDLGSARTINRLRINWEAAYAAAYRIVWSDNGTNWYYYSTNQYTRSGPGWADHTFSAWAHRYVGVSMVTRAPRMNNYSFWEFELYGPTLTGIQVAPESPPGDVIETDVLAPEAE